MKPATCHPDRRHKARGLCQSCYDVDRRARSPERRAAQALSSVRYRSRLPEADRKERVLRYCRAARYGVTAAQTASMLQAQNGKCCLCPEAATTIDHDHKTGQVRAMLCEKCNMMLGYLEVDRSQFENLGAWRRSALQYLDDHHDPDFVVQHTYGMRCYRCPARSKSGVARPCVVPRPHPVLELARQIALEHFGSA